MARNFNPLNFLRSAPNKLLEEYFARSGGLPGVVWEDRKERDIEVALEAISQLPEHVQSDVMTDFQELHARTQDGGFVKAILAEAAYHGIDADLSERLGGMKSHLERAFWIFLHRKEKYWDGSNVLWRVDKISSANQWVSRQGMPARPGAVDEGVVAELQRQLIAYFSKSEARGRRCKIEAFRRGEEEIFYAYPEDYKKTVSQYVGDNLEMQAMQPPFEIIFRHVDAEGRLDLSIEGDNSSVGALQVVFANAVLRELIEEEYDEERPTYELQQLIDRNFAFGWPPECEIDDVRVKTIRFTVEEDSFQRITIEADPKDNEKAVYDLLDDVTVNLEKALISIDQVVLSVGFRKAPNETRKRSRQVIITSPQTCRMTHDNRGEQIHRMLQGSGIEISGPRRSPDVTV